MKFVKFFFYFQFHANKNFIIGAKSEILYDVRSLDITINDFVSLKLQERV